MKYLLLAPLLLLFQSASAQDLATVAGKWSGSVEVTGQDLRTDFTFSYLDNELDGTVDIPQQMAFDLPVEFTKTEGDSLVFQFQTGSGPAVFRGRLDSETMTISGMFHQMSMSFPFSIQKRDGETASEIDGRKGTELLIDVRSGQASGTLLLADKPAPLVVLLTGSGAQDRDETVAGFKVFGKLAESLHQNGYSSFRYDDRGVGRSTGEPDATLQDLSDDLLDILVHLESEYDEQITHTILLGHSQGGLVSAIAAKNKDVDGIIFMGAPFLSGDEIINSQIETISEAQGIAEDIVEENLEFQERIYDVIRNEEDWLDVEQDLYDRLETQISNLPEEQREGLGDMSSFIQSQIDRQLSAAKTDWFKSFIEYDPESDIAGLQIPMLALFGENDTQVVTEPNMDKAETLRESAGLNLVIQEIETANHLFQRSNSGLPSEYGMLDKEFADGFVEAMIEWLNSL